MIDALVVANGRRRRNTTCAVKRSPICPLGVPVGRASLHTEPGRLSLYIDVDTTHVSFIFLVCSEQAEFAV